MDQQRVAGLLRAKQIVKSKGQMTINLDRDLPQECRYVDSLLASTLTTGRCTRLLRNLLVAHAAGIPQRVNSHDYLFEPEAICRTISILEGSGVPDITKGPFRYSRGPLAGLYKKHFFQASFIPQNILSAKENVRVILDKLSEHYGGTSYEGKPIEEVDLSLIAEALCQDVIERRAAGRAKSPSRGLTGEHLIYVATSSGNIYLYASFHDENLQRIADCVRVSLQEFPELTGLAPIFQTANA